MNKVRFLLTSLMVITVLLLTACGGTTSPSATSQPAAQATASGGNGSSGTSGTVAPTVDIALDPANATSDNARAAVGYIYEGLTRVQSGTPTGALAQSYTVSDDGLDYIFNLRSGVTFHDGSALNADVVVANFNRWFDPSDPNRGSGDFAAWAANFGGFKGEVTADGKAKSTYDGIEKVNEMTVLVHLNTVDADLLKKLADPAFSIVSSSAFGGKDGGTGPYKVGSVSGSTATLEPFSAYWDSAAIPSGNMDAPLQ